MRKEYEKYKISLHGLESEIAAAETILDSLPLTGNEPADRLLIQNAMDSKTIRTKILYDGNYVYSFKKVISHFKKALASQPSAISEYGSGNWDMSDYLYDFFNLSCGSIAHYNKYGWIGEYPEKSDLCQFILKNEFGTDIESHQPHWKTDARKIAQELIKIAKRYLNNHGEEIT